jgi:hypothetical protein
MSQPPDVIPTGSLEDKYYPEKYIKERRRRLPLELILVALVFLFLAFVFFILIIGSLESIENANKYLPTVPVTAKP